MWIEGVDAPGQNATPGSFYGLFKSEVQIPGQEQTVDYYTDKLGKKHGLLVTARGDGPGYFMFYVDGVLTDSAKSIEELDERLKEIDQDA